jgi:glycosyltransferase involved in cell wall biosynthesis
MNPLISIIVPVYNTANYLDECVTSLLQQTYSNCEFIFINDGSTDGSLSILEKYQATDARIIVINQENQGVSVARNQGLSIVKGTYIGFVDSDD